MAPPRRKTPRRKPARAKAGAATVADRSPSPDGLEEIPIELASADFESIEDSPATKGGRPRKVAAYRVHKEIGRGGMAVVYRGVHEGLGREVAIKELLAGPKDQEGASRFHREALALAGFRHQNIVTLYDLVEKNGTPYMILELVDGPTVSELIKGGPMPPEVAAMIAVKVASALEHAHLARITHRDIKPSNVMVTRAGEVKLMDFGIAKDSELGNLTKQGLAIGTPAYMSPEQVLAQPVDHRTDVYSLGVVLYECLSGKRAFGGKDVNEVFRNVRVGKLTSLRKLQPGLPWTLLSIVKKAMRVDAKDRYFDAAALRRDLELFLAKRVSVSHAAVMVGYLFHRGRLTETEVLERITHRELHALDAIEKAPARSRRRSWVVASALGAGALTLALTEPTWMRWLERLFP